MTEGDAHEAWQRAERQVAAARKHLDSLTTEQALMPQKPGQDAPAMVWVKLARHASALRHALGLGEP